MKLNYLVIGSGLEKQEKGFSGIGPWKIIKFFYQPNPDDPDEYGEFYINFNEVTEEAEFVYKDKNPKWNFGKNLLKGLIEELL